MITTDPHIALSLLKYYHILIKQGDLKVLGQEVQYRQKDIYVRFTAVTNGLLIWRDDIRFSGSWVIRENAALVKIYIHSTHLIKKINIQAFIKKSASYDSMGII